MFVDTCTRLSVLPLTSDLLWLVLWLNGAAAWRGIRTKCGWQRLPWERSGPSWAGTAPSADRKTDAVLKFLHVRGHALYCRLLGLEPSLGFKCFSCDGVDIMDARLSNCEWLRMTRCPAAAKGRPAAVGWVVIQCVVFCMCRGVRVKKCYKTGCVSLHHLLSCWPTCGWCWCSIGPRWCSIHRSDAAPHSEGGRIDWWIPGILLWPQHTLLWAGTRSAGSPLGWLETHVIIWVLFADTLNLSTREFWGF